jgi:methionine synthase I (cobalamin-dependent)
MRASSAAGHHEARQTVSFERIRPRLRAGRPVVLDADTVASFRARGVELDSPGAVGKLLRCRPADVLDHYRAEVERRVSVVCALTADTTPRALAEVGMEHRSALLTGLAVELAEKAAAESDKPVAVAGVLGSELVCPVAADRLHEELTEHAFRVATAGAELLIVRGQGSRVGLMSAVVAATGTELPVWAVVECTPSAELSGGGSVGPLIGSLTDAGASAVLFEVPAVDVGIQLLERALSLSRDECAFGVLIAGGPDSVTGFPDLGSSPRRWAEGAALLDTHGARIIGGGAGTTEAHTDALARALGAVHPSIPVSVRCR